MEVSGSDSGRQAGNGINTIKKRRLEIEPLNAAEKPAQYVARSKEVEARLAVVEQIVTDGGIETASQIEALRAPRLCKGDKVQ